MQHVLVGAEILIACVAIAATATALVLMRPTARRRRRRRRLSGRHRIDLFAHEEAGASAKSDA